MRLSRENAPILPETFMRETGLRENQRVKDSKLGLMEGSTRDNSTEVNPVGLELRLLLKELK
jgi:hypothetical protein